MTELIVIILVLAVGTAVWAGRRRQRKTRQLKLMNTPLPDAWLKILDQYRPEHLALSDKERKRLHGCINVFLDEKHFEGCGGLVMTDEIRVVIAAQACMLLLNRPIEVYPKLTTILVYPHTYVANNDPDHPEARLGESWNTGVVVLAWDSVQGRRCFMRF
jgi:Mlc titration factor MtfA (ptsG expression regulator)